MSAEPVSGRPDFGTVTSEFEGTVLECKAIAPGLTLHDLTMAFERGKSQAEPGDEFAGDPGRWPDVRGVQAVADKLLDAVFPPHEPVPEAELVEMHLDSKGLEFRLRHPIIPTMAEHLASAFKAAGGQNYVTFEIDHEEIGPLSLIMQRRWGETPERQAAKFREALTRIMNGEDDAAEIARSVLS